MNTLTTVPFSPLSSDDANIVNAENSFVAKRTNLNTIFTNISQFWSVGCANSAQDGWRLPDSFGNVIPELLTTLFAGDSSSDEIALELMNELISQVDFEGALHPLHVRWFGYCYSTHHVYIQLHTSVFKTPIADNSKADAYQPMDCALLSSLLAAGAQFPTEFSAFKSIILNTLVTAFWASRACDSKEKWKHWGRYFTSLALDYGVSLDVSRVYTLFMASSRNLVAQSHKVSLDGGRQEPSEETPDCPHSDEISAIVGQWLVAICTKIMPNFVVDAIGTQQVTTLCRNVLVMWSAGKVATEIFTHIQHFVLHVVERVYFYLTGLHTPFYDVLALDTIPKWIQSVNELLNNGGAQEISNDVAKGLLAKDLLVQGYTLSHAVAAMHKKNVVNPLVIEFNLTQQRLRHYEEVINAAAYTPAARVLPLVVHFVGPPGVGKSVVVEELVRAVAEQTWGVRDFNPSRDLFARHSGVSYWDGYRSQLATLFDDAFQLKDPRDSGSQALEVIRAANDAPFQLQMAELSAKASTWFCSKMLVLTSNIIQPAASGVYDNNAFLRRRNFVYRIVVKEAYRISGTEMFDTRSLAIDPTQFVDTNAWLFEKLDTYETDVRTSRVLQTLTWDEMVSECVLQAQHHMSIFNGKQAVLKQRNVRSELPADCAERMHASGCVEQSVDAMKEKFIARYRSAISVFAPRLPQVLVAQSSNQQNVIGGCLAAIAFFGVWFWMSIAGHVTHVLWWLHKTLFLHRKLQAANRFREKIVTRFGPLLAVLGVVSAVTASGLLYKTYCSSTSELVTESDNPKANKKPWHITRPAFTAGELRERRKLKRITRNEVRRGRLRKAGMHAQSTSDPTALQLLNGKLNNATGIVEIVIEDSPEPRVIKSNFIAIGGRDILVPSHLLDIGDCGVIAVNLKFPKHAISNIPVEEIEIAFDDLRDIALVRIPLGSMAMMPCIVDKFFPSLDEAVEQATFEEARLMKSLELGNKFVLPALQMRWTPNMVEYRHQDTTISPTYTFDYRALVNGGDCGSPIILFNKRINHKVLGIHIAGDIHIKNFGVGVAISQQCIEVLRERLGEPPSVILPSEIPLQECAEPPMLKAQSSIIHMGKLPPQYAPRVNRKTDLMETEFCAALGNHDKIPAVLSGDPDPLWLSTNKYGGDVVPISRQRLKPIEDIKVDMLNSVHFQQSPLGKRVLTDWETLNGASDSDYYKPMEMTTSPGYPYNMSSFKKDNGINVEATGKLGWVVKLPERGYAMSTQLEANVRSLEDSIRNGQMPERLWLASLKDEKRLREKVAARKTRQFVVAPLDLLILLRKYFGAWIAHLECNYAHYPVKVGINAHSLDWERLNDQLTCYGEEPYDGDFKEFDGTLAASILYMECRVINRWYDDGEVNMQTRQRLFEYMVHARVIVDGHVVLLSHCDPSGNPMTSLLNSEYTHTCWLLFIYETSLKHGLDMSRTIYHTFMAIYGDDNSVNLHPLLRPHITHQSISDFFQTLGMKYTLLDGRDISEAVGEHQERVFLGRLFYHNPDFGHIVGALNKETILQIMNYRSEKTPAKIWFESAYRSLTMEAAYHGRDFHQECVDGIRKRNEALDEPYEIPPLCSYDHYVRMYKTSLVAQSSFGAFARLGANRARQQVSATANAARARASQAAAATRAAATSAQQRGTEAATRTLRSAGNATRTHAVNGINRATEKANEVMGLGMQLAMLNTMTNLDDVVPLPETAPALGGIDPQMGTDAVASTEPSGQEGAYENEPRDDLDAGEVGDFNDTVAPVVALVGGQTPGDFDVSIQSSITSIAQRPRLISSGTISASQTVDSVIFDVRPWTSLLSNPQLACILNYFLYVRGSIEVELRINTTRFHYGLAKLAWRPFDASVSGLDANTIGWWQHIDVQFTGNNVVKMLIPWKYYYPWLEKTDGDRMGSLTLLNIVAPASATDGVVQPVNYVLHARFVEFEVAVPVFNSQGAAMSALSTGVSVATTVAMLNASQSSPTPPPSDAMVQTISGMSNLTQTQYGPILSPDGKSVPHPVDILGEDPIRNITPLLQRYSVTNVIGWFPEYRGKLFSTNISPMNAYYANNYGFYNPLAYFALPFERWHGTIRIKVQVCCSSFHTGRLVLGAVPPSNAGSVDVENALQYVYSAQLDISSSTEMEFIVPQLTSHMWLQNYFDSPSAHFFIGILAPLSCQTEVVPPARIVLSMAAGSDFEVAIPNMQRILDGMDGPTPPIAAEAPDLPTTTLIAQSSIGVSVAHQTDIAQAYNVDQSEHFNPMTDIYQFGSIPMHRYTMLFRPGEETSKTVRLTLPIASSPIQAANSYDVDTFILQTWAYMQWLQSATTVCRGSVNWSIIVESANIGIRSHAEMAVLPFSVEHADRSVIRTFTSSIYAYSWRDVASQVAVFTTPWMGPADFSVVGRYALSLPNPVEALPLTPSVYIYTAGDIPSTGSASVALYSSFDENMIFATLRPPRVFTAVVFGTILSKFSTASSYIAASREAVETQHPILRVPLEPSVVQLDTQSVFKDTTLISLGSELPNSNSVVGGDLQG